MSRSAKNSDSQKGAVNTLFLSGGIVAAVIAGAVMHRCLCAAPSITVNSIQSVHDIGHGRALRPADRVQNDTTPLAQAGEQADETGEDGEGVSRNGKSLPKLVPLKDVKKNAGQNGKWKKLTFEKLGGYTYKFPDVGTIESDTDQIPKAIYEEYDKQDIEIRGFIIPIRMKEDRILEFVLVINQMACCFGQVPAMNEWIHCVMEDGKSAPYEALEVPSLIRGKFSVGEVWENGVVMSLYRLKVNEVIPPKLR